MVASDDAWPNLLVLDEPTNDLDLATIEVLEEVLQVRKGMCRQPCRVWTSCMNALCKPAHVAHNLLVTLSNSNQIC